MKTFYLFATLLVASNLFFSAQGLAQPTLTGSNTNPAIGQILNVVTTGPFIEGHAGAGQTWNFSALTSSGTGSSPVSGASTTAFGSSFANANLAVSDMGSSTVSYYHADSAAWQYYGNVTGTTPVVYSDPEDLLRYPFTYTDSYTDTYAGTYLSNALVYRKGTVSVTADAYGTLILPSGPHPNALRVHRIETQLDSMFYNGVPNYNTYYRSEYAWYIPGNTLQVAYTDSVILQNGVNGSIGIPIYILYGGFSEKVFTGIEDEGNLLNTVLIFPNPSTGHSTLQFQLVKASMCEFRLFNGSGKQVGETIQRQGLEGSNQYELNMTELPKGIYLEQIVTEGDRNLVGRRIVVE